MGRGKRQVSGRRLQHGDVINTRKGEGTIDSVTPQGLLKITLKNGQTVYEKPENIEIIRYRHHDFEISKIAKRRRISPLAE